MTLQEMRVRMTAAELARWRSYSNYRPFNRREYMHGEIMSSMWALHGGPEVDRSMTNCATWRYEMQTYQPMSKEDEAQGVLSKFKGVMFGD